MFPVQPFASVDVTVNVELPGVEGVPLSTAVVAFNETPDGNAPLVTV
jgi:hypothetical protein